MYCKNLNFSRLHCESEKIIIRLFLVTHEISQVSKSWWDHRVNAVYTRIGILHNIRDQT